MPRRDVPPPLAISDLDYELPESLIATRPVEPRDAARLLVVRRDAGTIEHRHVRDLPACLGSDDHLVFNDTRVLPARFEGVRTDSGGRVEGLYLGPDRSGVGWRVMLRSNGRLRSGLDVEFRTADGGASGVSIRLDERAGDHWIVTANPAEDPATILSRVGRTPLPPYIRRARRDPIADDLDRAWYQTVYAHPDRGGSVAAPTAGLHFTAALLERLAERGVSRHHVTLHVGAGTFKPITADSIDEHEMHHETFEVRPDVLGFLRTPRSGRVVAVGTTTTRCLESLPDPLPEADMPIRTETDLLIAPGYRFRHVDALLTNFHLPRSTLLALVAALVGLDRLQAIYAEAVQAGYRFYSYGDAMLIL